MKKSFITAVTLSTLLFTATSCHRSVRTAVDITPGNPREKMDWRYGAADIRIQTSKISRQLMDRWYQRTGYQLCEYRPRIIITQIDNCTDQYIATDMIRDIIEGVAVDDGRFTVVVGNPSDEREMDYMMAKITQDPKYSNSSRLTLGMATAPQFLGKIRITKAIRSDRFYNYEDYRFTVTLYDIETQEAVDSAWDVLSKKVSR